MSFDELQSEFERRKKEKQDWYDGSFLQDTSSNLTPAATLGYYDLQNMTDQEYKSYSNALQLGNRPSIDISALTSDSKVDSKPFFDTSNVMLPGEELAATKSNDTGFMHNIGVSISNGFYGQLRGLLGVAKGGIEQNIARAKKENKDYIPFEGATSVLGGLDAAIANIEHQDVKGGTPAEQLAYDLTEGAVQLAMQILVAKGAGAIGAGTAASAGYNAKKIANTAQFAARAGSGLYMGANIAGDQYIKLRKEGVDADRAAQASLMNAPAQAILEGLGIGKILEKLPANSSFKKKLLDIGVATFEEGVTEGLQSLPEQLTDIWAKDPNATRESVLKDWWENRDKNIKEIGYSALLGGILGGSAKGIHVAAEAATEKISQAVIEAKQELIIKNAEIIQKSGINPETAAAYIDANSEGDVVVVEAKDLQNAFKQSTNNTKLAEALGVTEEEVNEAAALGQDIEITRGNYTAAIVQEKGLFEATKDGMYFDSNGEITARGSETLKDLRSGYKLSDELTAALNEELDGVINSALQAGMNKQHADNLRLLLESRALVAAPENPAGWLKKNSLRFENAGKGMSNRGWAQKAWKKNKSWRQNTATETKGAIAPQADGSYIISLFKGADASTVIHETGHYFVDTLINEALTDLENVPLNEAANTLLAYAGITQKQWRDGSIDDKRAGHEKLAEAFESYIMEGKAPSNALRKAFRRFTNWLCSIYSKIKRSENAAELTPEVREVFDNMLASREEIEVVSKMDGMFNDIPPELTASLSEENKARLQDKILTAKERAVEILTRRAMKDFSKKRQAEKAAYIQKLLPIIEGNIAETGIEPVRREIAKAFAKERQVNNPEFVTDANGFAHANEHTLLVTKGANPATIARKYKHVLGSILPNYNDILNDTNASINDILNPYIEWLQAELEDYDSISKERRENAKDMLIAIFSKAHQKTAINPAFTTDKNGRMHANARQKINEWYTTEANPKRIAQKYMMSAERINYAELLKDTNAAIDDMVEPIVKLIEDHMEEYNAGYGTGPGSSMLINLNGKEGYFTVGGEGESGRYMGGYEADQTGIIADFCTKEEFEHWKKTHKLVVSEKTLERLNDGFVWHPADEMVAHLWWGRMLKSGYTKSQLKTKAAKRKLAERVLLGEDINDIYDFKSEGIDPTEPEIVQGMKETAETFKRLKALQHDLQTQPEKVDLVKESRRNQLTKEQREKFEEIAEANGYASGYEMAREIVEGYTVNENEDSSIRNNWVRDYVRQGGDKAKLKSESGLREIAESLVEGEQLQELRELQAQKKELEENPDKAALVEMSKKYALSNEDRVKFEMLAESFGYLSGDAMANDILTQPSAQQRKREALAYALKEKFPNFLEERKAAKEAAREAIYNDETGELAALEQELILEAAQNIHDKDITQKEREELANTRKKQAENWAKAKIANMAMSEVVKARRFALAERRAAANARKAIKKGDMQAAAEFKQEQLFNHALYCEAVKVKHEVEKARRFIRRQKNSTRESWGTLEGAQQHFNQMCALLERMGLHNSRYDKASNEQTLGEYVADMQAKYGDNIIDIADWLLDPSVDLKDWQSMTAQQYTDVVNALRNIRAMDKHDMTMSKIDKDNAFSYTKADILDHLQKLETKYIPDAGEDIPKNKWGKIKEWSKGYFSSLRNADNFYLMLDGWADGYFTKNWYDTLNHCADIEAEYTEQYQHDLAEAIAQWEPDKETKQNHNIRRQYEELGTSVDKHTLIAMLLNMSNEGNIDRLCRTPPIGLENSRLWVKPSETITAEDAKAQTRQNIIEFLQHNLTKADIEYAQARINACSRFWGELAEVNRRTKGFAPAKVEAVPTIFKLEDEGSVAFKGGYYPLTRDSRLGSAPSSVNRISATDEYGGAGIQTLSTNTGTSKARIGGQYEVSLAPNSEINAVMNTIHDICYREAMLDFRKILNDKEIFSMLKSKLGDNNVRLLREQLQACANPYSNQQTAVAETWLSKAADALRNVATNTAIMLNLKTALQNFSNIMLYGQSVEGFTYADSFRALYRGLSGQGRADVDAICQKSVFMRERMEIPDVTLRDIRNRNDLNPVEKQTLKWGALLLGYTDMMSAKPVFAEAYTKKINEGATEQEAIDFANRVIRRTLGSSRIQDVSSLQRGSKLFRLFTMFQGFFNTQFNQWDREYHIANRLWHSGDKKEMIERLIAFVASKWLGACLLNIAIGELSLLAPFEDDKDKWNKLAKELINYPLSMGGPVGQASNVALQNLSGMKNYGYRLTATQGLIDKGFTIFRRVNDAVEGKKKWEDAIEPTAYVGGAYLGIPAGALNLVFNGYDLWSGDMEFKLEDLLKRRPKSERKVEND